MYRARLTRPTITNTDCEIVAVKTIKGKDLHVYNRHCYSMNDRASSSSHLSNDIGYIFDVYQFIILNLVQQNTIIFVTQCTLYPNIITAC